MAMELVARPFMAQQRPIPVEQWRRADLAEPALSVFLTQDKAASTQLTYSSHVRQFEVMIGQLLGLATGAPPTGEQLAQFIMGRTLNSYKFSYIELGVYAISAWSHDHFGLVDLHRQPVVSRDLKAAARTAVQWKAQKLPITKELLQRMLQFIPALAPRDAFIRARDAAMWQVGWYGMFRCSELLAIRWQDVLFCEKGVMVLVRRSKTDPGKGAWVFLSDMRGGGVAPATALAALWDAAGGDMQAHVFARSVMAQESIVKATVTARLHKLLGAAGVAVPGLFGTHSLRRGGATHAARHGMSLRLIMEQGRWRSDCVRQYMYSMPSDRFMAAQRVLEAAQPVAGGA